MDGIIIESSQDEEINRLDKQDALLISRILINLGVNREDRKKIIDDATNYEMDIRGYDFVLSILDSCISQERDFYWFDDGLTLSKRHGYFNWSLYRTKSSIGTKIKYVNNLMPDRGSIDHEDLHGFCKELEHLLYVLSQQEGYVDYQNIDYKKSSLAKSIKYLKINIDPTYGLLLDFFKEFRDHISHAPSSARRWIYRGRALDECYKIKGSSQNLKFSFLDDMFQLTEYLISRFKMLQHNQIDREGFINKILLIDDFNLFRGKYSLSADLKDEGADYENKLDLSTKETILINVDFSLHKIGFWLSDGRFISIPRRWHPEISRKDGVEIDKWTISADGLHVQWEGYKETISLDDILAGRAAPGVVK